MIAGTLSGILGIALQTDRTYAAILVWLTTFFVSAGAVGIFIVVGDSPSVL